MLQPILENADSTSFRKLQVCGSAVSTTRTVQAAVLPMLIHKPRLRDRALVDRVLNMADGVGRAAFERQQAAILARPDNRPFLAEIACPTVVIVGEHDALTPVKLAQELHEGIVGSSLQVIPDCGHLSTMEQPETVNAVLRDWLLAA